MKNTKLLQTRIPVSTLHFVQKEANKIGLTKAAWLRHVLELMKRGVLTDKRQLSIRGAENT